MSRGAAGHGDRGGGRDPEALLEQELRDHLEREVAARMRAGASEREARREARLAFGGLEQVAEACRDVRRARWLHDLGRDLRLAGRRLWCEPGFTATVVLTLALGMAANAAVFSLVDALLLRRLPVPDPEALVFLSNEDGGRASGPRDGARLQTVSVPLYQRLRAEHVGPGKVFTGLAAQQSGQTMSLVSRPGGEDRDLVADAAGRAVSADFFEVLGLHAHRGRTFRPEDQTAPGADAVMVLSHRYWLRRFGGDPALVGARLTVNGTSYLVVGVAPPGFLGTNVGWGTDFWVPLTMQAELMRGSRWLDDPSEWWLMAVGRLAPGRSRSAAQAAVGATLAAFLASDPRLLTSGTAPGQVSLRLEAGARGIAVVHRGGQGVLTMLMAAVTLLLAIVAVNVCHLLLGRATSRQRELQIRTALGASRSRLWRQLGAEVLLLCLLGGAGGALLAPVLIEGILALFPQPEALGIELALDGRLLAFIALLATIMAGLLGLVSGRGAPADQRPRPLQLTARAVTGRGPRWLAGRLLLVAQVALSLVLLVGAGLVTGTLRQLRQVDRGFDAEHVVVAGIQPRLAGITEEQLPAFYDQLLRELSALPGVRSASLSAHGLLTGDGWHKRISVVGSQPPGRPVPIATNGVSADYFDTVGMRLVRGRAFTRADRAGTQPVTVINQALARRLFGDGEPLGRRLDQGGPDPVQLEIVGVVRDARSRDLSSPPPPMYFTPLPQQRTTAGSLEVRSAGDPAPMVGAVRSALRQAHPQLTLTGLGTMREQMERSLTGYRLVGVLATAFGAASLLLVCVGLYGVIARWSGQRTQEIGVRMALGASERAVRRMVLRQALLPVLAGVALGLPAAMGLGRLLGGLLFGVRSTDPLTLALAALTLTALALAAAYLPARRASRVHPMLALRCE